MDKKKLCNKLFGNFECEWIIYLFQLHTRMPNYFYHPLHSRLRLYRWAVGQYFQILEKSGESTHILCCEAAFKRNYMRHESFLPLSAACINAVLPLSPITLTSAPFWMSNSASLSNPVHTIKTLKYVSKHDSICHILNDTSPESHDQHGIYVDNIDIRAIFDEQPHNTLMCYVIKLKTFISLVYCKIEVFSGMYLTMLPFKAAMVSAELFLSFTAFTFAPFSISIRTILSNPMNNWMNWLKLQFF